MTRRRFGLVFGVFLFGATLLAPAPAGVEAEAWRTAALGLLMGTWWITEAIPIPATALLPLALLPLLGAGDVGQAAAPFANPLIFLFLGGFLLALAMQRHGLPKRIALGLLEVAGSRPAAIVGGVMASCALLSMWVSNTATAMMMLPIGISIVQLVPSGAGDRFGTALMLGIAYACSIGGVATLIGTPPNAFLAAFLLEAYGIEIGFARWMAFGLPVAAVGLALGWLLLVRVAFRLPRAEVAGSRALFREERERLGAMGRGERRVAVVFVCTALAWILRPVLERWIGGLSDAGIAMLAGLSLFLVPSGGRDGKTLLDWETAEDLPWGVLVLFGGGLSLAAAVQRTGLDAWIGSGVGDLVHWPLPLLAAVVAAAVILLTELTSNTATAAAFLPVLGSVAAGVGASPLLLCVPAAVAASCAFMLPVATPPNAIVYASGSVTVPRMARAGMGMNLLFAVLIPVAVTLLLEPVFGAG